MPTSLQLAFVVSGVVVGVFSGLLGIGGAVVLVPLLILGFGFSQQQAQGTALGVLVPPIGIFAAIQYWRAGYLDVKVAALLAVGFVFGAFFGAWLVPRIPAIWLRRAFATLLVYVAVQLAYSDPKKKGQLVIVTVLSMVALWAGAIVRRLRRDGGAGAGLPATTGPSKPPTHHPSNDEYDI